MVVLEELRKAATLSICKKKKIKCCANPSNNAEIPLDKLSLVSSSESHGYLNQISWQGIKLLFRYYILDHRAGSTNQGWDILTFCQ